MDNDTIRRVVGVPQSRAIRLLDTPGAGQKPAPEDPVMGVLSLTRDGRVRNSALNLSRILEMDSRWNSRLEFNEFRGVAEIDRSPLTDHDLTRALLSVSEVYGIEPAVSTLHSVVESTCRKRPYHPVREHLLSLEWDGQPRIGHLVGRYIVPKHRTELCSVLGRKWLISAVVRALSPIATKVDSLLILIGKKGIGKSTLFRTLAIQDEWFSDQYLSIGDTDSDIALRGTWIQELSELDSLRRSQASTLKAWLSRQEDSYRRPYGRLRETHRRQVVFAGSSNNSDILTESDNRRFWPVEVASIDLEAVQADLSQLWAEAVAAYVSGETWHLEGCSIAGLSEHSAQFESTDPWADSIGNYLLGKSTITIGEIIAHIQGDLSRANSGHSMRVAAVLARLGWQARRTRFEGRRTRCWVRPTAPD